MLPFLQFIFVLFVIIAAAKIGGYISYKIGLPSVAGEVLAGLLLGPTLVDFLHVGFITDIHLEETIVMLAELGVLLLMFIAGLNLHFSDLAKSGRIAISAGLLSFIFPIAMGFGLALLFGFDRNQAIFFGLILAPTSVSISAQTLMELGVLRSKVGVSLLGAAVIDDMLVVLGLSLFLALFGGAGVAVEGAGAMSVFLILLREIVFLLIAAAFGFFILPKLTSLVDDLEISQGLIAFVFMTILLYAWSAEFLGKMATIIGAFMSGLFFARTSFKERIEEGFSTIAYSIFVPIFFVNVGLSADIGGLQEGSFWFIAAMLGTAALSKLIGVGIGGLIAGLNLKESFQLGVGMIPRGEVVLIVATVGITEGIIGQDIFSSAVVVVVLTTLLVPPILRLVFAGSKTAT